MIAAASTSVWVLLILAAIAGVCLLLSVSTRSMPNNSGSSARRSSPTEVYVRQMVSRHGANTAHHIDATVTRRRIQNLSRKGDSDAS